MLRRRPPPRIIDVHPFDIENGADTSGYLDGKALRTGHRNDQFVTAYFGVPPSRFLNAIEKWRTTPGTSHIEKYRFIDVGCGKGRAVMLASRLRFRDAVGVELSQELVAVARANLERWQETSAAVPTQIYFGDASTVVPDLIDGPSLVYLYNPFRAPVLRELLRGILEAQTRRKAALDLLYLYPEHEEVFSEFAKFQRVWHADIPLADEDAEDGISEATDPCSLYRLIL